MNVATKAAKPPMGDEAIRRGTGRGWDEWIALLDSVGARAMKHRDIAILKTMGATMGSIRRVFMLQGLIIGVAGIVLAVIVVHVLGRLLRRGGKVRETR